MSGAGSGLVVLLVEDETLVAGMLQGMLSALGYSVAGPADSVDAALAIIQGETVDAAVLDINLNGKMSYPVADELNARGIPFVFSTGYGIDTLPAGYEDCVLLKKPFRRATLRDALEDLLQARQPRSAASA